MSEPSALDQVPPFTQLAERCANDCFKQKPEAMPDGLPGVVGMNNQQQCIMKTLRIKQLGLSLVLLTAAVMGRADKLELKNGQILDGKYLGGTANSVRFETSAGVQAIETSQVIALTFTGQTGAGAAAAGAASSAPAGTISSAPPGTISSSPSSTAQSGSSVTLPAGTALLVRTVDSVSSQSQPGATFSTRLETDLVQNGRVLAPAGTPIYGRVESAAQARRAVGQSSLQLRLNQLVVGGKTIPISTSDFQEAGQRSGRKSARGAAAGAAIGGIAGDAGKGAGIGAIAGAARRGGSVTIPAGTLLEFTLTQPVTVPAGQ